jgi:hypothetical protein
MKTAPCPAAAAAPASESGVRLRSGVGRYQVEVARTVVGAMILDF